MQCPFCDAVCHSEDELGSHIAKKHPEKTMSAQAFGDAFRSAISGQVVYNIAASLTATSVSCGVPPEEVLIRFKFFCRELYPLFFGAKEPDHE